MQAAADELSMRRYCLSTLDSPFTLLMTDSSQGRIRTMVLLHLLIHMPPFLQSDDSRRQHYLKMLLEPVTSQTCH